MKKRDSEGMNQKRKSGDFVRIKREEYEEFLEYEEESTRLNEKIRYMKKKKKIEVAKSKKMRDKLEHSQHKSKHDWIKLVQTLKTIYDGQLISSDREVAKLIEENKELQEIIEKEREKHEKEIEKQKRKIENREDRVFETLPVLKVVEKQVGLQDTIEKMQFEIEEKNVAIKKRDRMIGNLKEQIRNLKKKIKTFEWHM